MKPHRKYIKNKTVKTFKRKIRELENKIKRKEPTEEELESYLSILNSYLGYFKKHKTFKIINNVLKDSVLKKHFGFTRGYERAIIIQNK